MTETTNSLDYLHSFPDEKIVEIIANPKMWTEAEIELVKKISEQ
jgi:hypothetical protein